MRDGSLAGDLCACVYFSYALEQFWRSLCSWLTKEGVYRSVSNVSYSESLASGLQCGIAALRRLCRFLGASHEPCQHKTRNPSKSFVTGRVDRMRNQQAVPLTGLVLVTRRCFVFLTYHT
jgi:hypothetical protein